MPLNDRAFPWAVGVCVVVLCGALLYALDVATDTPSPAPSTAPAVSPPPRITRARPGPPPEHTSKGESGGRPATNTWIPPTAREVVDRGALLTEATHRPPNCALRDSLVDRSKGLVNLPEAMLRAATAITDEEERALGQRLRPHLIAGLRDQGLRLGGPADQALQRYLDRLLLDLLGTVKHRDLPYRVELLKGDMVNAFATPGGSLFITDKMVSHVQSEAELLAVVAHEVGHVERRHPAFAYQLARHVSEDALAMVAAKMLTLPISTEHEREADHWGTEALVAAHYDPLAGARFWAREARQDATRTGQSRRPRPTADDDLGQLLDRAVDVAVEVFESHPPASDRCARAMEAGAEALRSSTQPIFYRGTTNLRMLETGPQRAW